MKAVNNFGKKLRELRENAGLSQKQLAAQIGLSKATVSQYENQGRIPSPASVIKIAAVLHVSTDYLFGIDETERADLTGLTEEDIEIINRLIRSMREKNNKISKL